MRGRFSRRSAAMAASIIVMGFMFSLVIAGKTGIVPLSGFGTVLSVAAGLKFGKMYGTFSADDEQVTFIYARNITVLLYSDISQVYADTQLVKSGRKKDIYRTVLTVIDNSGRKREFTDETELDHSIMDEHPAAAEAILRTTNFELLASHINEKM